MNEKRTILVADDNGDDFFLLRQAFAKAGVTEPLTPVENGAQAIAYLRGDGIYSDREKYPWPALMLLDLKMPGVDGFEVLYWWQQQEHLSMLPIVVLSSSSRDADIQKAISMGAEGFCVKPAGFDYFVVVARELHQRWLAPETAVKPGSRWLALNRHRSV